ncbi:methyltransferase-like 26 B [Protopterus annectens]|uniref:methyltransferase-like 26 B n=1 Tax=Protopterus annectens TaxID=7888 RepID=UPI001CFA367C|nr:methyltransferase-like 26 B [Protopterus annectens]
MLVSPAAERNKDAILEVLTNYLDPKEESFILEIASGSGQHIVHFAQALPGITWQPSEINQMSLESVSAYITATKVSNVRTPLYIDFSKSWESWAELKQGSCDAIICINVLQFSTPESMQGIFQGAGNLLKDYGVLLTYGPFAINGIISPKCNAELDISLQKRNPEWGLRDIDVLRQLAGENSLRLERMLDMPEHNKCLIFRKTDQQ